MLHTLGRPARPVVTGERWGRGSEPYGLCIRTAYTDACASLRDGSESNIHSEGSRRTGGQESLFLSWVSGLGRGPATLFTLEHSAGCAGKPDTRLSVHVPSSLTIPRHTAACLARAYSWGGFRARRPLPGCPEALHVHGSCLSPNHSARRTQEDPGVRPLLLGEKGGLGEEQSPAARGPRACLLTTPLLGWSRALWGKGSDGLGFVF